jgi:hypothetical protein
VQEAPELLRTTPGKAVFDVDGAPQADYILRGIGSGDTPPPGAFSPFALELIGIVGLGHGNVSITDLMGILPGALYDNCEQNFTL